MKQLTRSFEFQLFALSFLCGGALWLLRENTNWYHPESPLLLAVLFFALLSWGIYRLSIMALKASNKTFTTVVLGSMLIRMFFSIFFIAISFIITELKDKAFIISFLLLYLIFSMFEIFHLVFKLRAEKQGG